MLTDILNLWCPTIFYFSPNNNTIHAFFLPPPSFHTLKCPPDNSALIWLFTPQPFTNPYQKRLIPMSLWIWLSLDTSSICDVTHIDKFFTVALDPLPIKQLTPPSKSTTMTLTIWYLKPSAYSFPLTALYQQQQPPPSWYPPPHTR